MTDPQVELDELARARRSAHPHGQPRLHADDPDYEDRIGIAGEAHFARAFGFKIDKRTLPAGDGRFDFSVRIPKRGDMPERRVTIDVKTTPHPDPVLFVKPREIKSGAFIFVLCRFFHDHVKMLGWETRAVMSMMPIATFGKGISSHWRMHDQLRPMSQLADLLAMRVEDDDEVTPKEPQTDTAEPMDEDATQHYEDDDTQA